VLPWAAIAAKRSREKIVSQPTPPLKGHAVTTEAPVKRPYHTPELRELGSIAAVTQNNPSTGSGDTVTGYSS